MKFENFKSKEVNVSNTTTITANVNSTVKSLKTANNNTTLPLIKPLVINKEIIPSLPPIQVSPINSQVTNITPIEDLLINNNNQDEENINKLKSDIITILNNIESISSQLINTSSITKEILDSLSDLKTEFLKMEYEFTASSNENHKRVSLLNERLSSNMKELLKHQLFIVDQSLLEINANLKKDQAELSSLEFDIYLNSKCLSYDTCSKCSSDPLCGWCSSNNKCIEGNSEGPILSICSIYSYSICNNESYCNRYTCDECIANLLCSWCSQSTKPFCSKLNDNISCDSKDLVINLLGENNICPRVNLRNDKEKNDNNNMINYEREAQNAANRKAMQWKYNQLKEEIKLKKSSIDALKLQENKINEEIEGIEQSRNDFKIIEEDGVGKGYTDEFKRKMMNVFRTDLQSFLESIKEKLQKQLLI